ncbi:hypothetical protein [Cytobacillus firmus]|nr:hypothetical protein [Cytobacillus firmus]
MERPFPDKGNGLSSLIVETTLELTTIPAAISREKIRYENTFI